MSASAIACAIDLRGQLTHRRRMATLADVAASAGVSASTASRALNGRGELSAATRAAVHEAAARLDFQPSPLARSLRTRQTYTVGFVVPDVASPFYAACLKGAQGVLETAGYRVMLMDSEQSVDSELAALRTLVNHQVDGLLVATAGRRPGRIRRRGRAGNAVRVPRQRPRRGRRRRRHARERPRDRPARGAPARTWPHADRASRRLAAGDVGDGAARRLRRRGRAHRRRPVPGARPRLRVDAGGRSRRDARRCWRSSSARPRSSHRAPSSDSAASRPAGSSASRCPASWRLRPSTIRTSARCSSRR